MSHFFQKVHAQARHCLVSVLSCGILLLPVHVCAEEDTQSKPTTPQQIADFAKTGNPLPKGVDINVVDDDYQNALHLALINAPWLQDGTKSVVQVADWLIQQGISINATDEEDRSALHYAARYGDLDTVKLLIKRGAKVNLSDHGSICDGIRRIKTFLPRPYYFSSGTPLHEAAEHNHTDICAYLLEHGARVNAIDHRNRTPLFYAAFDGNLDIVKLLLAHNASATVQNDNKETTIYRAMEGNMHSVLGGKTPTLPLIQMLHEAGADIDQADEWGRTPLMLSLERGLTDIAEYLVEEGANIFAGSESGFSLLHLAAKSEANQVEFVKFLIEQGLDINQQDSDNHATPLHYAAFTGNIELVEELLAHNARVDLVTKTLHETPLFKSLSSGHKNTYAITRALVEAGSDIYHVARVMLQPPKTRPANMQFYAKFWQKRLPELYAYVQELFEKDDVTLTDGVVPPPFFQDRHKSIDAVNRLHKTSPPLPQRYKPTQKGHRSVSKMHQSLKPRNYASMVQRPMMIQLK